MTSPTPAFQPGFRLQSGDHLNTFVANSEGCLNGVTAGAGGGQAAAVPLTAAINRVTTVASANDSVSLPAALAGLTVIVINGAGANSMQVFGLGSDTVNDVAAATGVAQAAGKTAAYYCPTPGKWYRLLSA